MKTKNLFLVPVLIAVLALLPTGRVTAQTFTPEQAFKTLHTFTGETPSCCTRYGRRSIF